MRAFSPGPLPAGRRDRFRIRLPLPERLAPLRHSGVPPGEARIPKVRVFTAGLATSGPFDDADGTLPFAHGHRRRISAPGLWLLCRHCAKPSACTEGAGPGVDGDLREPVLLAGVPLWHEAGKPLAEGALVWNGRACVIEADQRGGQPT